MRPEPLDGCRRLAWYRRLLREEEGIALIFAIVSLVVLTAVLTAVIFLTAAGAREAQRSNAGQRAYSLAESGLNNALAILNANYPGTLGYPGDDKLLSTTLTSAVTLPAATIGVANTTDFNPAPGTNTIALRSAGAISGPITCTGISATSFTGCTGGAAGTYPVGATVGRAAAYAPGFSQWSGTLDNSPPGLGWFDQWNITATGSVVNPTGPAAAEIGRAHV